MPENPSLGVDSSAGESSTGDLTSGLDTYLGANQGQDSSPIPGEQKADPTKQVTAPAEQTADDKDLVADIDPKYASLPKEEAAYRTLKSKHDKLYNEHKKSIEDYQTALKSEEFLVSLTKDEELLFAFLNEVKPGLVKPKDISQSMKEAIVKEFGEDFKPDLSRDEALKEPWSKDFLYYQRVDEIYKALTKGAPQNASATVKELLARRAQQAQREEQEVQAEIEKAKKDFNMDDAEVQRVIKTGNALRFADLVRITRFIAKFPSTTPNGLQNLPGFSQSFNPNQSSKERLDFLKDFKH